MSRIIATSLTLLFTLSYSAAAQGEVSDEVKSLVVMVDAELDGGESSGAGIVFNVARNRVYIVTADHVVRRGDVDAEEITVEFWQLPGEQFEATLLSPLDTSLDMAVLTARTEDVGLTEADFPFGLLTGGDVDASSSVTSVGQGSGRDWVTLVEPTNVIEAQAGLLELQAAGVSQGDSGGGIFSETGELLGMIVSDAPPALRAIEASTLLSELENNRYAVASAGGAEPSLASETNSDSVETARDVPVSIPADCPENNTFQCATFLPFGSSDSGTLEFGADNRYYEFELDRPGTVIITLDPMPNERAVEVSLYDAQYTQGESRRFEGGQPGSFEVSLSTEGLYYIRLDQSSCCGGPNEYTLTLNQ